TYQRVHFYTEDDQPTIDRSYDISMNVPGETRLPDGSMLIASMVQHPSSQGKYTYICNHDEITLSLHVRSRRPGDRMEWKGLKGRKKLKDIFIDHKIPLHIRDDWPIVTDASGRILWVIGLKKSVQKQQ